MRPVYRPSLFPFRIVPRDESASRCFSRRCAWTTWPSRCSRMQYPWPESQPQRQRSLSHSRRPLSLPLLSPWRQRPLAPPARPPTWPPAASARSPPPPQPTAAGRRPARRSPWRRQRGRPCHAAVGGRRVGLALWAAGLPSPKSCAGRRCHPPHSAGTVLRPRRSPLPSIRPRSSPRERCTCVVLVAFAPGGRFDGGPISHRCARQRRGPSSLCTFPPAAPECESQTG